jgi:hypothetical protein
MNFVKPAGMLVSVLCLTLVGCQRSKPKPTLKPALSGDAKAPDVVKGVLDPATFKTRAGGKFFQAAVLRSGKGVRIYPLQGKPILAVGNAMYPLTLGKWERDRGLESLLFDKNGKEHFITLQGHYPDNILVSIPISNDSKTQRVVLRQYDKNIELGIVESQHTYIHSLALLPNHHILVRHEERRIRKGKHDRWNEIIPTMSDDDTMPGLDHRYLTSDWIERKDGSLVMLEFEGGEQEPEKNNLVTWAKGSRVSTRVPATGLHYERYAKYQLKEEIDGQLYLEEYMNSYRILKSLYRWTEGKWEKVETDATHVGKKSLAEKHAEISSKGSVSVPVYMYGRNFLARVQNFVRDSEGTEWALSENSWGVFANKPVSQVVELSGTQSRVIPTPSTVVDKPSTIKVEKVGSSDQIIPNGNPSPSTANNSETKQLIPILTVPSEEAKRGKEFVIHPTTTHAFVSVGSKLLDIDDNSLRINEEIRNKISVDGKRQSSEAYYHIDVIGGRYPDNMSMQTSIPMARMSSTAIWSKQKDTWKEMLFVSARPAYSIVPLAGDWLLLATHSVFLNRTDHTQQLRHRLSIQKVNNPNLTVQHPFEGVENDVDSWAALPDGTVYAFHQGKFMAWSADGSLLTVNAQPVVPKDLYNEQMVALSANEIYLLFQPLQRTDTDKKTSKNSILLRFDGGKWSKENLLNKSIKAIKKGPRHTLWAMINNSPELWERSPIGKWKTKPNTHQLDDVWVSPKGDVWATADYGKILLHSGPLDPKVDTAQIAEQLRPYAYHARCPMVALFLKEVPRTADTLEQYAKLWEAFSPILGSLRTQSSLLEMPLGGKRNLIVYWDEELVDKQRAKIENISKSLIKEASGKLPNTKPRLICLPAGSRYFNPKVLHGTAVPKERSAHH